MKLEIENQFAESATMLAFARKVFINKQDLSSLSAEKNKLKSVSLSKIQSAEKEKKWLKNFCCFPHGFVSFFPAFPHKHFINIWEKTYF